MENNNPNEFDNDSENVDEVEDIETSENIDGEVQDENTDDSNDDVNEVPDERDAEIADLKKKNKQLYARAQKNKDAPAKSVSTDINSVTQEDVLKIAKGLTEQDIINAKMIAQRDDIKLIDALDTDDYKVLSKNLADKTKAQDAQLRTSRGKKVFTKPKVSDTGLSKEDHERLWREKTGN